MVIKYTDISFAIIYSLSTKNKREKRKLSALSDIFQTLFYLYFPSEILNFALTKHPKLKIQENKELLVLLPKFLFQYQIAKQ